LIGTGFSTDSLCLLFASLLMVFYTCCNLLYIFGFLERVDGSAGLDDDINMGNLIDGVVGEEMKEEEEEEQPWLDLGQLNY